jgi:hypothetical protein
MLSKKLVELLETFDRQELARFRKYLCSALFNENEDLIKLFDLVAPHLHPGSENGNAVSEQLSKQKVWKKMFPSQPYNDALLRRLCSDLTRHAYGFLTLSEYRSDPAREQNDLMKILVDRKLDKHFHGAARKLETVQIHSEKRDGEYHYHKYLSHYLAHLHREQTGLKVDTFEDLELADMHLDCFYFGRKLKHYCDALDYRNTLSIEADIKLFPDMLGYLEGGEVLDEPSVQAYYLVARMLLDPQSERYFQQLKKLLAERGAAFTRKELDTLYIYLKNYCINTKINNGFSEYFHELFDIFRTLLQQEVLFQNGRLDPQDYKNIITVGLQIGEFDWVEDFIQRQTSRLPADNQENALNYNLAKVYFHQEQYERVIEQLREVEYRNLTYALGSKLMLLKTYFELDEYLALDSLIDSFRIYLRRNRMISRDVKRQYLNVLRFVKKLSNVDPYDKQALSRIKQQVIDCKALAAKKWLLEKVEERER